MTWSLQLSWYILQNILPYGKYPLIPILKHSPLFIYFLILQIPSHYPNYSENSGGWCNLSFQGGNLSGYIYMCSADP